MFERSVKVTTSCCDTTGLLKFKSALEMMQDCSELWIQSEPEYNNFFKSRGLSQFLASRQVEIVRVPHYLEDLTVRTQVYDFKNMFGLRNTFIYDSAGCECYRSWNVGAFVNLQTGNLTKLDDEVVASCVLDERLQMNYRDRHIRIPDVESQVFDNVKIMRSDIDYNHHVNNTEYVRIAMEFLPDNFVFSDFRVEYKNPAKLGDSLTPIIYKSDNSIFVVLKNADKISTLMEFSK